MKTRKHRMNMTMTDKFVFHPRIIRSPLSDFYGNEIETALDAYPDDYLRQIADQGYSGIWLHIILRDTVASSLFPGNKMRKTTALNRLVEKVSRLGIKVYAYFCEPRSLREDHAFWKTHRDLAGQPFVLSGTSEEFDGRYLALCTGTLAVREFLEESSYRLFQQVPGLGGAFLITASEYHTHCYSHYPKPRKTFTDPNMKAWSKAAFECPRCRKRTAPEVTAEVIRLVNRGIKRANPEADVMAWTWSWYILEPDPQERLINMLPRDVILISDLERGGFKRIAGKRYPVDEYSFSSVGPSPRFRKQCEIAKRRGMRMMAKIQIGSTHEMASVPYLPLPHLLAEKMKRMRTMGVDGYLGCWIFGGDLSPMSRLAGIMSRAPQPSPSQAVRELARSEFGDRSAASVCLAWRKFSRAWRQYPFSIPLVYSSPVNYATAYPLSLKSRHSAGAPGWRPPPRTQRRRLKVGDDLERWVSPFGPKVVIKAFQLLLKEWKSGVDILKRACRRERSNEALAREYRLARHIALSVRSTINVVRFHLGLRRLGRAATLDARNRQRQRLAPILREELNTAIEDIKLVESDPRLGYHSEAHTSLFTLEDLRYKVSLIRRELRRLTSQLPPDSKFAGSDRLREQTGGIPAG